MEKRTLALKNVSEALNLDSSMFYQAAFAKYLQSIHTLSLYLNDIYLSIGFQKILEKKIEVLHVLSMVHECSDRIETIVKNEGVSKTSYAVPASSHLLPKETDSNVITLKKFPVFEKMQNENILLLKIYKNRLEKTTDKFAKTNLKLELERRLAENAIVTKAKYDAAVKKLQRERVQIMENEIRKLFETESILSEKEREKRQLYTSAVNYAKTELWPSSWKLNYLEVSPFEAAEKVFMKINRCHVHPLSQWLIMVQMNLKREVDYVLKQYSEYIPGLLDRCEAYKLEKIGKELIIESSKRNEVIKIPLERLSSLQRSIEQISSEIRNIIGNFLEVFYLIYKSLLPDDSEVLCYQLIEAYLLKTIWPSLIILYRIASILSEYKIFESILVYKSSKPAEFNSTSFETENSEAFTQAISLLMKVPEYVSLVQKLKILGQIMHLICDGYPQTGSQSKKRLGADDLVPHLCFIILQSNLPQLISECIALEQLFDMKYMLGEEGYTLSSFLTALRYLEIKS